LEPAPLRVIRDGKFLRRNMRAEFITQDELMSLLRQQGVYDVKDVKWACVESDGGISVYPPPRQSSAGQERPSPGIA
jgi:uncharacterized membrane protein YcaP (DUF421 family)